jgi:DNA invertase Pin-like site-specific DNA recombinase
MRLDGYIRVSRVNGRKGASFISPDVQRDAIERWCEQHGHEIVEWHEEMDRSGGAGKRRPVFERVLARIEKGETGGVVVWKFSRFGRSQIEASIRIYKIEQAGAVVESATEGDQSKLTRTIMLAIAEDELDRLTDSWAEGLKRAVARGVWIGPAPFGYRRTDAGTLEVFEPEARIVREAFRLAAADGLHAAMRYLAQAAPDKRWRTDEARKLLSCRAYLGEVVHGEHHNPEAHTPLVTPATWEAAQTKPRFRRSNGNYPLSHIARCDCGGGLVGGLQTHARTKRTYRRYRCTTCNQCSISADKLEGWVRETLEIALADEQFRDRFSPDGLKEAQDALKDAEAERTRFGSDLEARKLLGHDGWIAGLEARARAVEEAQERFRDISSRSAQAQVLPAAGQLVLPDQFERALAVIDRIVIRRGRGSVSDRVTDIRWSVLDGDDMTGAELAA